MEATNYAGSKKKSFQLGGKNKVATLANTLVLSCFGSLKVFKLPCTVDKSLVKKLIWKPLNNVCLSGCCCCCTALWLRLSQRVANEKTADYTPTARQHGHILKTPRSFVTFCVTNCKWRVFMSLCRMEAMCRWRIPAAKDQDRAEISETKMESFFLSWQHGASSDRLHWQKNATH